MVHLPDPTDNDEMVSPFVGRMQFTLKSHQRVTNNGCTTFAQPVVRRIQLMLAFPGVLVSISLLLAAKDIDGSTSGGSRETDENELAVIPIACCVSDTAVTTHTPVAKRPRAFLNSRPSKLIAHPLPA
jgi:hypothetical protein